MEAAEGPATRHAVDACARGGLIAPASEVARELFRAGHAWWHLSEPDALTPEPWIQVFRVTRVDVIAYIPRTAPRPDSGPDLAHARAVFAACRSAPLRHLVVVSSAAAHAGLEDRLARPWRALEWAALSAMGYSRVTVVRACTPSGVVETLKTLAPGDLVSAMGRAMQWKEPGTVYVGRDLMP